MDRDCISNPRNQNQYNFDPETSRIPNIARTIAKERSPCLILSIETQKVYIYIYIFFLEK